jgi:threonine/homoserine/homoserine lactone efflux protein
VWLGGRQLWLLRRRGSVKADRGQPAPTATSRGRHYLQGLLVSLSNPKVLLFLAAFLPQFVDADADPVRQLAVLAVLFVAVLATVDVAIALVAARARAGLRAAHLALADASAGVLLLAGGLALAMVRRP